MNEMDLAPRAAVRSISATDASTSQNGTIINGGVGAPLVEDEVVVGADAQLRKVLVLGGVKRAAGEAAEIWEAQLGPRALDVHVLDAVLDVVAAGKHVVIAARVHPEVARVLARHGVEGKVAGLLALVEPGVVAVGQLHDARSHLRVLGGHPVQPHARVLDDVVVDRDDLGVVGQHARFPPGRDWYRAHSRHREWTSLTVER